MVLEELRDGVLLLTLNRPRQNLAQFAYLTRARA
jgi:hypothetical protein